MKLYIQRWLAYPAHTVANFQRTLRIRQQIISVHCACCSKLLTYPAHTVINCKGTLRTRELFVSALCAYVKNPSNIHQFVAYTMHAVVLCQRILRIRLQIVSVRCACGYKLLAYTAHAVTKIKRPISNPSVQKIYFFI